jgi:hypothetical protein
MNEKSKLIIGRVAELDDETTVVVPLGHGAEVLDYQKRLAALISAAHLFQADRESMGSLEALIRAARAI